MIELYNDGPADFDLSGYSITDNPDAPDEEALEEYQDGCSSIARKRAEQDWDSSKPVGVGGSWTLHQ